MDKILYSMFIKFQKNTGDRFSPNSQLLPSPIHCFIGSNQNKQLYFELFSWTTANGYYVPR